MPPSLSEPKTDRQERRWTAFLLSILTPGLGHLAVGYPRRMVAWYLMGWSLALANALVIAISRSITSMLVALFVAPALCLGAGFDTLRLRRAPVLPTPRIVFLVVAGVVVVVVSYIIGAQIRAKLVQAFQMPSGSMYPTLEVGDHLLATKLNVKFDPGEVVVFHYPVDPRIDYVKRILAVAGDRVEIQNNTLVVNGVPAPRSPTSSPCLLPRESMGGGACTIWEEEWRAIVTRSPPRTAGPRDPLAP